MIINILKTITLILLIVKCVFELSIPLRNNQQDDNHVYQLLSGYKTRKAPHQSITSYDPEIAWQVNTGSGNISIIKFQF